MVTHQSTEPAYCYIILGICWKHVLLVWFDRKSEWTRFVEKNPNFCTNEFSALPTILVRSVSVKIPPLFSEFICILDVILRDSVQVSKCTFFYLTSFQGEFKFWKPKSSQGSNPRKRTAKGQKFTKISQSNAGHSDSRLALMNVLPGGKRWYHSYHCSNNHLQGPLVKLGKSPNFFFLIRNRIGNTKIIHWKWWEHFFIKAV